MIVVALQLLVSFVLVAGSLVLFVHSVRQRDFEHDDRLSLAPIEDDETQTRPHHPHATSDKHANAAY